MARQIAANSPEAIVATKAAVDRATEVDDAVRVEATANARLRGSPEHHARFREAAARVAKGNAGTP
jgi:enoyl-CoA hydratase/carnithine racemase